MSSKLQATCPRSSGHDIHALTHRGQDQSSNGSQLALESVSRSSALHCAAFSKCCATQCQTPRETNYKAHFETDSFFINGRLQFHPGGAHLRLTGSNVEQCWCSVVKRWLQHFCNVNNKCRTLLANCSTTSNTYSKITCLCLHCCFTQENFTQLQTHNRTLLNCCGSPTFPNNTQRSSPAHCRSILVDAIML